MTRHHAAARASVLVFLALFGIFLSAQTPPRQPLRGSGRLVSNELRARAERNGRVRVIVELKLPGRHVPEGDLRSFDAIDAQRREIFNAFGRLTSRLRQADRRVLHRYQTVPYVALEMTPSALAALETESTDISRVFEDELLRPVLAQSGPIIQADQAWSAGYDGDGTTIAILDTGVDGGHPFLGGKVVGEACFSTSSFQTRSTCPNGTDQQLGSCSGVPCSFSNDCVHGTHVAGIAAGNGAQAGQPFSGIARAADLMAVQVFAEIVDPDVCGSLGAPCAGAFASDIIAGLEHVYALSASLNVVAVNMSLGGAPFDGPCDAQPFKPAIDNLRSIGIATVVASGNSGVSNGISSPACISSTVSVGSTSKADQVSSYSNVAPFLSLFAPGQSITSSVPGGGFQTYSGTSMAAPHVAGTWAVLRQAVPAAGVSLILDALRQTGVPITDTRVAGGATIPRVKIYEALAPLTPVTNPAPTLTSISPSRVRAGTIPVALTFTGSGFNALSRAYWNGAQKPTSVASTSQLTAQISPADLAAGSTAQVFVSTPAPGGGTTISLQVVIDPPPTLSVSATSVAPGASVTATLANGFGGAYDWLALAPVAAPDNNYVAFTYVGAGVTNRTWTVTMPSTAGAYEFRLFRNNVYQRAATSPAITVDAALSPAPTLSSLAPSSTFAGSQGFTLTVNGSGFVSSSVVRWNGSPRTTTFVSATQLQAAITSADITTSGTVPITVFTPAPGGGSSSAAMFTITPPAVLTVSATTVPAGSTVTATLTNGKGAAGDWLALASTSAPNNSYVTFTYVGTGVTSRTWTVTMPSTPGSYEFRYFPDGGYTCAATSPTVNVQGATGSNPVPAVASLTPASLPPGSAGFDLTVSGSGFVTSSVVRWNGANRPTIFISSSELRAAIPAADVASAGTASVTVFSPAPGGGTSSSRTFTIGSAPASPTLSVGATSVTGGSPITVTLTNGPGGFGDWMSFAPTSASDSSYQQFVYVGSGVTSRTWTVTAPMTPGTYEFRLFLNNSYTRAATSPAITVTLGQNPVPSIGSLSPSRVAVGGAAFTLTVSGSGFVSSSVVRWNGANRSTTFVSSSQLTASIPSSDLTAVGVAQVTVLSPTPGGGTSSAATVTVAPPPTLTVSATTVAPGASVTVTLTDGFGGSSDWLSFASTSAPESSYVRFVYVGGGVTTRTWTVTAPTTPGAYEFRLFLNNGYVRAATSPVVTVSQ